MLVNLTKKEIKILIDCCELSMGNPVTDNNLVDDVRVKLMGIHDACTCKEQNEDSLCKLTHKAELSGHS